MTTPPQPPQQPPAGGGFGPPPAGGFGPAGGGPGQQPPTGPGQPPAGPGQSGGGFGQPPAGPGQQGAGWGQPPAAYGPPAGGQGGFGQPGFPGPYGGPPPNPPNRSNKIVAIVAGAVLVVALAVAGTMLALSGDDDPHDKAQHGHSEKPADDADPSEDAEEPSPSPTESDTTYELAFPKTLENGTYTLKDDLSDSVDPGAPGQKAHLGSYANSADTARLLYGAATGEDNGDPEGAKDQMMDGMESGQMKVAVKRRDFTPAGSDDPLTCEVLVKSQAGRKLTVPVCAWSDPGTAAYVADDSLATYSVDPDDVDLQKWADRVDGIRDEVRSPAAD